MEKIKNPQDQWIDLLANALKADRLYFNEWLRNTVIPIQYGKPFNQVMKEHRTKQEKFNLLG